jgi:hypothetical protein
MSDGDKDWLEEELADLRDMQAPPTLLPKVMERVRSRSRQRLPAVVFGSHACFKRSIMMALSVFLLVGLMVVNPSEYFDALPWLNDVTPYTCGLLSVRA